MATQAISEKIIDHVDYICCRFIAASPFAVIATKPRLWIDNGGTIAVKGVILGAGAANGLYVDGYPGVQVRGVFLGPGAPSGLWVDSDDLT